MKKLFNLLLTSVICIAVVLGSVGCDKANYTKVENDEVKIAEISNAFASKLCEQTPQAIENYTLIGSKTYVESDSAKIIKRDGLAVAGNLDGSIDLDIAGLKLKGSSNIELALIGSASKPMSKSSPASTDSNLKAEAKAQLRFSSSAKPEQIDNVIRTLNKKDIESGYMKDFDIIQENAKYNAILNKDVAVDLEAYFDNGLILLDNVAKFGELNYLNGKVRFDINDTYNNTKLEPGEVPMTFANTMGADVVMSIGEIFDTVGFNIAYKDSLKSVIIELIKDFGFDVYIDAENLCFKFVAGANFVNLIKASLKLTETDTIKINKCEVVGSFNKQTKKLKSIKANLDAELNVAYQGLPIKGNVKLNAEINAEGVSVKIPSKNAYAVITPLLTSVL